MQKSFKLPKYAVDALGGIVQYEWRSLAYVAPLAVDPDYYINEFEPTASGAWIDITANLLNDGVPDVIRNAKLTITDANDSISVWVHLHGEDQFGNAQQEILRVSADDTNKFVMGKCIWSVISAVYYKCTGTVTGGADDVAVGIGDSLGLPVQIGSTDDIKRFVGDTGGTPDDELADLDTELNAEFSSVLPGANSPNGTKVFWVEVAPTKPHDGVLPVRPRGTIVVTTTT